MMPRKVLWLAGALTLLILIYFFYPSSTEKGQILIGRDPQNMGADLVGREAALDALTDQVLEAMKTPLKPVTVGKDYFRSELEKGTISGFIFYGEDDHSSFQGLLQSHPFFLLGPILVVRKDSPITTPNQMEGKSLAVMKHSSVFLALDKLPPFKIQTVDTIWTLFDYALTQRVQGIILDALPAYLYLHRIHKDTLRFVPPPLTRAGLRLFAPSTPEGHALIERFNQDLDSLIQTGKLGAIYTTWDFSDYPAP